MKCNLTTPSNELIDLYSHSMIAGTNKALYLLGLNHQNLDPKDVETIEYRFWSRVVDIYNQCDLTVQSDKLPALEGLARAIAKANRQTYFAGLWLEDIARGLYWKSYNQQSIPFSSLIIRPESKGV
jgi:hypothetical protein